MLHPIPLYYVVHFHLAAKSNNSKDLEEDKTSPTSVFLVTLKLLK